MEGGDWVIKKMKARRLWSVVKLVVAMMRGIAGKRMQRMAVDVHLAMKKMRIGARPSFVLDRPFGDHYEFSCSSTPVIASISGGRRSSIFCDVHRLLLRALPCVHISDSKAEHESVCLSLNSDLHLFNVDQTLDPLPTISNNSSPATTRCSNCSSPDSLVGRQAEEFIARFYYQLRLQRQDSYGNCQEMLARDSN
eukprot:Gb_17084 [translate_table: standard]